MNCNRTINCTPRQLSLGVLLLCFSCTGTGSGTSDIVIADMGATLELGNSQLVIPSNALQSDTEISLQIDGIEEHSALTGADQVLNIQPSDIQLSIPATLTLNIGDLSEQNMGATVWHFSDSEWIRLQSEELSGGGLEVTTSSLGAFAVVARSVESGNKIRGTVSWNNGGNATELPVNLLQNGSLLRSTQTDSGGVYQFVDVSPGIYTISTSIECPFEQNVEVQAETDTSLDITLCQ